MRPSFGCSNFFSGAASLRWLVFLSASFGSGIFCPALTVATYNVENYLVSNRMIEGVYREAYPKPEKERAALAEVISSLDADVLAVQEMGAPPFFEEFQRELKHRGAHYPFAVLLEGPDADRHVAVLSKFPFHEVFRHAKIDVRYLGQKDVVKRGVLEVVFRTTVGDLSVFVVHLKSRRTEQKADLESAIQRREEAEAVRNLVLSRRPEPAKNHFIVCGDWNDTPGSKPVQAMRKRGDLLIGELVPAMDARGETWTHFFRREDTYSRVDYLLVSPALKPLVRGGVARIAEGADVSAASDHRPVVMQLNLEVVEK